MLTRLEQTQQKYGGASTIIDAWLAERQELLVKYCKLAGLPPFDQEKSVLPEALTVNRFCQILVDYLSAGHFEVYDNIVKECEKHGPDSVELAKSIYPKISATTEVLVNFNDKYSELVGDLDLKGFDTDLSVVGQILEERLELEDELIHTLHTNHS